MGKEVFSNEEVLFLNQLMKSLEESQKKLEQYYKTKDYNNFEKTKKFILSITEKISEIANEF